MKYFIPTGLFVFAGLMLHAQMNNKAPNTYKQKQLNETLQAIFPDLQGNEEVPFKNNMPVLSPGNESAKVNSNTLGDKYRMNVDQMPCLKPFKTKDETQHAVKPAPALPIPPKAKE